MRRDTPVAAPWPHHRAAAFVAGTSASSGRRLGNRCGRAASVRRQLQPRALPFNAIAKDAGDALASTFYANLENADDWLGARGSEMSCATAGTRPRPSGRGCACRAGSGTSRGSAEDAMSDAEGVRTADRVLPIDETLAGCTPRCATRTPSRSRAARQGRRATHAADVDRELLGVPRRPAGQRRRRRPDVAPRSPRPDHVIHPRAITVADLRAVNLFGPLGSRPARVLGAGRDDARGRRPARSPSGRATAQCWVKRPSTVLARTGDETPLISRTTSKRPQTADNEVSRKRTKNPVLPGISPPLEAFDRTTENRGVGGSSPPLATSHDRNPAVELDALVAG